MNSVIYKTMHQFNSALSPIHFFFLIMPVSSYLIPTSRRVLASNVSKAATSSSGRKYTTCSQLPEEHQMIYEMCRKFADEELAPNAGTWDQKHLFPTDAVKQLTELGMMGLNIAEEYGGPDLDALAYAISMEEISRGCASVGAIMSAHNSLYLYPIDAFGTPEQKEQWIAPYAACAQEGGGMKIGCFGLSEPGNGSDAGAATTTATLDGSEWIINGTKA